MNLELDTKYEIPKDAPNVRRWDEDFLLFDRDFLLVWFSQVTTLIGGSILGLAVAFLASTGEYAKGDEVSSSAFAMGLVILLNNFPSFFISFIAGVLADWYDRKKIMMLSNLFRVVVIFLFLLISGWKVGFIAYGLIFVTAAAKLVFIPSEASVIPDIVSRKNILSANSIFNLTNQITYLAGFIFAGPLLELMGAKVLFDTLIVMFILATIAIMFVRVPEREINGRAASKGFLGLLRDFLVSFLDAVKYIYKDKIQKVALAHSLSSLAMFYIFVALAFKVGEYLIGLTPQHVGLVAVLPLGLGMVVTMLLLNTIYKNAKRMDLSYKGVLFELVAFVMLVAGALIKSNKADIDFNADFLIAPLATAALVFIGLGFPLLLIPSQTLIQEQTQEGFLGRVYGIWMALSQALASIPAVVFGFLADKYLSVPVTLIIFTSIIAVYIVWIRKYRYLG